MASLYRRHRPRTFDDVVGQEHVVRTLRNAIERDRVHHAYLFVGSRGTGKTSMAKILAASLNCERGGPTVQPCGACESCRSIHSATSLDVIEMDAASNNSVDDIRDLRERVAYAPVSGRSKVYILDEAHMLSTAAWNAFLKTLEEPPPNTIFVLATTEAQKVLPTVADRCHRFDFTRPTVAQIAGVLRRVADQEGIRVPDEACALIARSATGSFRDALGTLEQLVAYSGASIAIEDVLAVLGAADSDLLFGTVDAIHAGNAREALLAAARLAESGRDVARFFTDLEAHLRALMVVQALGGSVPVELRVTADQDERLAAQAARVPAGAVVRLLDLLAAGLRAMKDGADARTQLELALVKAATPAVDPTVKALLARIERLEGRGAATPASRAPEVPATPAGAAVSPAAAAPPPPAPPIATTVDTQDGPVSAAAAAVPSTAPGDEPAAVAVAVVADHELDLTSFNDMWPAVLDQLSAGPLGAFLAEARPVGLDGDTLTVAFADSAMLLMRQADRPANRDQVAAAVRAVTGRALRLAYETRAEDDLAAATPQLSEDELVERFVKEFDAEILPPEEPKT